MPAQSRIADYTLSIATGTRTWTATAAVQDTAAGGSVVLTLNQSTTGVSPPLAPTLLHVELFVDNTQTRIFDYTWAGASGTTFSFYFTSDGTAVGSTRAGTIRIRIHAQNTGGLSANNYNVTSDADSYGSPTDTFPTGGTRTQADQGWIRGTTTCTQSVSNISAGGGKNSPFSYGTQVFVRTTLADAPFQSSNLTVGLNPITATATSATTVFDATLSGVVDNRWPVAATSENTTLTVPNASLPTGVGWTSLTNTTDSATVDPRLYAKFYMQLDDNVVGTPVDGVSDPTHNVTSRLTSNIGFITCRVVNAFGTGISGIAWNHSFRDLNSLVSDIDTSSSTTGTLGGQTGWDTSYFQWLSSLPGGSWLLKRTITTGSATGLATTGYPGAPASAMTGSGSTFTGTPTLLAVNPNIRILAGAGPLGTAADDDHWHPGDDLLIGLAVLDHVDAMLVSPDSSPAPSVMIGRFNQTLARAEYLKSDYTWAAAGGGATVYKWVLTQSIGDPQTWILTIPASQTTVANGWTTADLFIIGLAYVNGTPYSGPAAVPALKASINGHNRYRFDGAGFLGFPSK